MSVYYLCHRLRMRSDALHHRTMLIEAAARVFVQQGYDVPLELVLADAGLGRGTLYRHFADRNALVVAVFQYQLDSMAQFVATHRASPTLLRELLQRHAAAGVFATGAVRAMISKGDLADVMPLRARSDELFNEVIANAKGLGLVGEEFSARDLRLAMRMVIAGANGELHGADGTAQAMEDALDIVLKGIRPDLTSSLFFHPV